MKLILLMSIFLVGCSSIKIIEKPIEVPVYIERQDTLYLTDSVTAIDTFWYSDITDSLEKVIGNLKVWYKKKVAELQLKYKDTVSVVIHDTVEVVKEKPITVISDLLPLWAEGILIGVAVLLLWLTQKGKFKLKKQ